MRNIGVAKAPSISLHLPYRSVRMGKHMTCQISSRDLQKHGAGLSRLAAPIFTGGAIAGQVKAAEAVQQQALLTLPAVIQNAFREAEDSLVDQRKTKEQLAGTCQQVGSLRIMRALRGCVMTTGTPVIIEVLDAQSGAFNAELTYAQTQGVLFQAMMNLYKAMGGGWITEAEQLTVQKNNERGVQRKYNNRSYKIMKNMKLFVCF